MGVFKDLKGLKFGLLLVLDRAESQSKKTAWNVRCDCGTTKVIRGDYILNGKARSCGCASEKFRKAKLSKTYNLVNQRFGRLVVVWRAGSKRYGVQGNSNAVWECKCDCGKLVQVTAKALRNGQTKSCGCLLSS